MSITMQGSWTVAVKSQNASYKQRFLIQGSDNADGIYIVGNNPPPPLDVTGAQWTITIQHLPRGRGASWRQSAERLGTPVRSGGTVRFDILYNDSGGDQDYDDLILTCSMPESPSEYVIHGTVRSYSGRCLFNPCFPYDIVIDLPEQLDRALRYSPIRDILGEHYPDRIRAFEKRPPVPEPEPDPRSFRPLMIPLGIAPSGRNPLSLRTNRATEETEAAIRSPLWEKRPLWRELLKYRDKFIHRCPVKKQPGLLLRFIEYDRTASELGGGPYTGTGNRKILGLAATDEQGNYIFRFSWTLADISDEIGDQPVGGGPTATELRPDLIVQVVSGTEEGPDFLFETALLANIPNLKRVNLCIPEKALQPGPPACQGKRAIQSIGNIWTLTGVGNSLDAEGRITATNPNGPRIVRGAWNGILDLFACFVDFEKTANPVKFYTIRYRRPGGEWRFVRQPYSHIKIADIGSPDYTGTKVGPFTTLPLRVDGGSPRHVEYYLNIESDPEWILTKRTRKIRLSSALYENSLYLPEEEPRTVEFRIDGYDENGNPVPDATDSIKLYLDSRPVSGEIKAITLDGETGGECALFNLPAADSILATTFRVRQPGGFVQSYQLSVLRGSGTPVSVNDVVAPVQPLSLEYDETVHGDAFHGTADAVAPDLDDYVTAELQPASGSWLPTGTTFCAFAFEIHARPRTTNGYGLPGSRGLDVELVGISHTTP